MFVTDKARTNKAHISVAQTKMTQYLLLLFLIGTVLSQNYTDTNGGDFFWFNPQNIKVLSDKTPVSGTIYSWYQYSDYYIVNIPSNTKQLTYRLEHTNYGSSCNADITAAVTLDFWDIQQFSYPTYSGYAFNTNSTVNFTVGSNFNGVFIPQTTQYVTVIADENYNCTYNLEVDIELCPENSVLVEDDSENYCLALDQSFTYNSQSGSPWTYSGTLNSTKDKYLISTSGDHMKITRLQILLETTSADAFAYLTCGYATTSNSVYWLSTLDDRTYNATTGIYSGFMDYAEPDSDVFCDDMILVQSSSAVTSPIDFNITFSWTACSGNTVGWSHQGSTHDCSFPIAYPSLNLYSPGYYTVTLPPATVEYASAISLITIPYSTVGEFFVSCTTSNNVDLSNTTVKMVVGKYFIADCYNLNYDNFQCDGNALPQYSQHLYPGGNWAFTLCSNANESVNVTIHIDSNAYVSNVGPLPSPSATPSASPTASTQPDNSSGNTIHTIALSLVVLVVSCVQF